jgi:CRP-like cAMP-binding protein
MLENRTFWVQLDKNEQAVLLDAGRIRRYAGGEVIIHVASPDNHAVVLLGGRARVIACAENGRGPILALRGPGEIVGELPSLDGGPRSAIVEAIGPVRGLVLSHDGLRAILNLHPRIMGLISAVVATRLREADRRRAEFSTVRVLSRTAAVILEFAEEMPGIEGQPRRLDIVTQVDLAGLVGTSRESIARALAELRGHGAVSTARGSVTVLDMARLRAAARPAAP